MSDAKSDASANKMWGGRFAVSNDDLMIAINASIGFDKVMAPQDIRGSKAHADMLAKQGIITKADAKEIQRGLDLVATEIQSGKFQFKLALEDIHMNVESRLAELIGPAAGRLHTARSRNDQVALDFRLYVRDAVDAFDGALLRLMGVLVAKAETHADVIMPGFTHLQPAQPVTFGHHMLAYVEMLARDRSRFQDARTRMNECPLGAAALAGTSFPIDRAMTAEALGFDRPTANSLDSVADRDFALPRFGAGKQQVGDIHAGDQENESNRAEQHEHGPAHSTNHFLMKRECRHGMKLRAELVPAAARGCSTGVYILLDFVLSPIE